MSSCLHPGRWEVCATLPSFMVLRAWEAAFPCRHTLSQALWWTVHIKVKGRDYFFWQNVRKLNLLVYWLLELFRKMSSNRMCENQGKARIKNPWIKNPQTKRWGKCLRTKEPVARQVCHAWISGADDRKPVRGWRTMTKPTQGKLNSQLQISGTFPQCDKARVILTGEETAFLLWSGTRQGCLLSDV